MSIGQRLTLIRKSLDISQAEMSMVMGCNQSNISYYEKDAIQMSVKYLIPLRNAYNVNIDWLLTGEGKMFNTRTINRNIDKDEPDKSTYKSIEALQKENTDLSNQLLTAYKKIAELQDKIIEITTDHKE